MNLQSFKSVAGNAKLVYSQKFDIFFEILGKLLKEPIFFSVLLKNSRNFLNFFFYQFYKQTKSCRSIVKREGTFCILYRRECCQSGVNAATPVYRINPGQNWMMIDSISVGFCFCRKRILGWTWNNKSFTLGNSWKTPGNLVFVSR